MTNTSISLRSSTDPALSAEFEQTGPLAPEHAASMVALAKLGDAAGFAFSPDFSPAEAEAAGAFVEDALSEADAREAEPHLRPPVQATSHKPT